MKKTTFIKSIAPIFLLAGVTALSSALQAASFDCAKAATNIEKLICSDTNLSVLDEQLSSVYKKGLEAAGDKDAFKKEQLNWLKTRNTCGDAACLTETYQARVDELELKAIDSPGVGAVDSKASVPKSSSSDTSASSEKVIKFTLLEGEGYPLCKEYVDMLNKTRYTEIPVCSRKILPEFKNFKEISWIEMMDKEIIKKVLEERSAVLIALNPTAPKKTFSPHNEIRRIDEGKSKMFSFNVSLSDDGVEDVVYRMQNYTANRRKERHGHCEIFNNFYFYDSALTTDSIESRIVDPYNSFNIGGSNELFMYGDRLFVSIYSGNTYYKVNLEVYGVGNKKLCGILAK